MFYHQKESSMWLDVKTKDHVLQKFPAARSDSFSTRRCSVCVKKKLMKLGGIVESVVFLCILGNAVPGATLSECTKTSAEGVYKVSDSCVS
jgi:hypothetical protein